MAKKELTKVEIHEKIGRRVYSTKKWVGLLKFNFFGLMVLYIVALYKGDTREAIIFLSAWIVMLLLIMRHNQHKLILILWDELRAARELPADNNETEEKG